MSAALTRRPQQFPLYPVDFKVTETDEKAVDVGESIESEDDRTNKLLAHLSKQCEEKSGLDETEHDAIEPTDKTNVDGNGFNDEGAFDWNSVSSLDDSPGEASSDLTMNEDVQQQSIARASSSIWEDKRQHLVPYRGLINLGNTCYLNSALQMLFTLDSFVDDIIAAYHDDRQSTDNNPHISHQKRAFPLRDALASLFLSLRSCNHDSTIDPSDLKETVDALTPQFVGFWQQDSHEFLSTILDLLHDEMMPATSGTYVTHIPQSAEAAVLGTKTPTNNRTQDALIQVMATDEKATVHSTSGDYSKEDGQPQDTKDATIQRMAIANSDGYNAALLVKPPVTAEAHGNLSFSGMIDASQHPLPFSQLNVHTIGDLLHGASPSSYTAYRAHENIRSWVSSTCAAQDQAGNSSPFVSSSSARLVGGRTPVSTISLYPSSPELTVRETRNEDKADDEQHLRPLSKHFYHTGPMEPRKALSLKMSGATCTLNEKMQNDTPDKIVTDSNSDLSPVVITSDTTQATELTPTAQLQEQRPLTTPTFPATPVDDYFTTQVRIRLTCDSCKYSRTHQEIYRHLSIEVESPSNRHGCTVHEGLRKFFAPETRDIKCEQCFCESATQTTEITRLPKALLLHFKRFIVDFRPDTSQATYRKNRSPVEFGKVLTLENGGRSCNCSTNFADDDCCSDDDDILGEFLAKDVSIPPSADKDQVGDFENVSRNDIDDNDMFTADENDTNKHKFRLRSIVHHIGNSASCGHYTADAFRRYGNDFDKPMTEDNRAWTRFNDGIVTRMDASKAMGESAFRTAYMVLYELVS